MRRGEERIEEKKQIVATDLPKEGKTYTYIDKVIKNQPDIGKKIFT